MCMGGCGGSKKSTPQVSNSTRKTYATSKPKSGSIQGYAGFGQPKVKLSFSSRKGR